LPNFATLILGSNNQDKGIGEGYEKVHISRSFCGNWMHAIKFKSTRGCVA